MLNTSEGSAFRALKFVDSTARACAPPNNRAAPVTPHGVQRPNATAASAINPRPLIKLDVN